MLIIDSKELQLRLSHHAEVGISNTKKMIRNDIGFITVE